MLRADGEQSPRHDKIATDSERAASTPQRKVSCSRFFPRVRTTAVYAVVTGSVMVWSFYSILRLASNKMFRGEQQVSISAVVVSKEPLCESPSLPRGSIHIVVAAYKYSEREAGIGFDDSNYLWDLGLTNSDIFWYRRVQPEQPLREVEGRCGMKLHERLLLPNYGRDGSAFFDHVLEVYDNPPTSIIFLHGHAAIAWHTSCESVFARSAYVYRALAWPSPTGGLVDHSLNRTVLNHMMTLTSNSNGTSYFDLSWFGSRKDQVNVRRLSKLVASNDTATMNKTKSPCELFRERWNEQVFSRIQKRPSFQSCCASFILKGERIQKYPRAFYEDLQSVLTDESYGDQGRHCFEFLVYLLFSEEHGKFTQQELQAFYDEADGLVHGRNRSVTAVLPDDNVLFRMQGCKATHEREHRAYVRRRKWRNTWKRFGIYQ